MVGIDMKRPRAFLFQLTPERATMAPTNTIIDCRAEQERMKPMLTGLPALVQHGEVEPALAERLRQYGPVAIPVRCEYMPPSARSTIIGPRV